ncbi:MAG TPA: DUF4349 domain-containing protein [Mucilaginibacter sp.]|jgi:hypothetical protein|nr:DUF4349 domain-containing protein [Mucilaginibacter sp.]
MKTKFLIPLAGLALLCACKGKSSSVESADPTDDTTQKVTLSRETKVVEPDTIQNHPKIVKTADMHFQVKSVRQTTEQITALTENYNGQVIHHVMRSAAGDSVDVRKGDDSVMRVTLINSTAEMIVKIPPANLVDFMNHVAQLGIRINDQKMDVNDKSLDYLSTRLKLKNQSELVESQKKTIVNKKDPDNLLAFKNNMVDQQINNRKIDDSVKFSTVILSFYENNAVSKRMMADNNLADYQQPFSKRFGMSFENGWNVFVEILIGVSNFWILIPVGLGIWLTIRYFKRKMLAKG